MLNDGALEVDVGLVGLNLFTFSVLHMLMLNDASELLPPCFAIFLHLDNDAVAPRRSPPPRSHLISLWPPRNATDKHQVSAGSLCQVGDADPPPRARLLSRAARSPAPPHSAATSPESKRCCSCRGVARAVPLAAPRLPAPSTRDEASVVRC